MEHTGQCYLSLFWFNTLLFELHAQAKTKHDQSKHLISFQFYDEFSQNADHGKMCVLNCMQTQQQMRSFLHKKYLTQAHN